MNQPPTMSQKIFDMQLSVETVSVYLLCCSLADAETPLSRKNLASVWNGTAEELEAGIRCLTEKNIMKTILSDGGRESVFKIVDVKHWEK